MKLFIQILVVFGMLLPNANSYASELSPMITDNQLGLTLRNVAWPPTLAKDFASGFENRILILVLAIDKGKPIARTEIIIVEKYDLWDELFRIKVLVAGVTKNENTFSRVKDCIAYLAKLNITDVFALSILQHSEQLSLQTDILINPVEREKIERVSRWVAQNSVPHVPSGAGAATLTAKPNSLFNTIYEQYVHGADIAAPWKTTASSRPFNLQELQTESRNNEPE